MIKCLSEDCDYFKTHGKCSSVCENNGYTKIFTNYDLIQSMSVDEMAKFLASHIGHYEAPYKVKDIYRNAIDDKTGKGIIWIDAFKLWLESEADE